MRVTYTYEFRDYWALMRAAGRDRRVRRHFGRWPFAIRAGSAVISLVLIISIYAIRLSVLIVNPVSAWIGIGFFYGCQLSLTYLLRRRMMRSNFLMMCNANQSLTIELQQEGINYKEKHGEGHYFWAAVERVAMTPDHLFLFVSPLQALIFPRRAFASLEDFTAAISFAKEKVHGQTL